MARTKPRLVINEKLLTRLRDALQHAQALANNDRTLCVSDNLSGARTYVHTWVVHPLEAAIEGITANRRSRGRPHQVRAAGAEGGGSSHG